MGLGAERRKILADVQGKKLEAEGIGGDELPLRWKKLVIPSLLSCLIWEWKRMIR